MWTGGKAERKEGKVHLPYVTGSLAILVLTGLVNVGMRAEDIDDFGASELAGEVEGCFKALETQTHQKLLLKGLHDFCTDCESKRKKEASAYSLVGGVEVKVYDVVDALLQHALLVVRVHEAHEIGVFQSVQQQLGDARLVLFGCHVHDVIPTSLLNRQKQR